MQVTNLPGNFTYILYISYQTMSVSWFQRKYSDSYIAKRGNKNVDIKFSAHERFWNNLHQVAQNRKIGKPNNLIVIDVM